MFYDHKFQNYLAKEHILKLSLESSGDVKPSNFRLNLILLKPTVECFTKLSFIIHSFNDSLGLRFQYKVIFYVILRVVL